MQIVHFFAARVNPEAAKVGSVHVLYYLSTAQKNDGHQVEWLLVPRKTDYENVSDGFRVRDYGRAWGFGFLPSLRVFQQLFAVRKSVDLVHLHGPFTQENVLISWWLRVLKVPYAVSSHGSFSPQAMRGKRYLKILYKHLFALPLCNAARLVHVHTEQDEREAIAFGVKAVCVVAEHGSDHISSRCSSLDKPSPEAIESKNFNLLFLGRLDPWHKGLDVLLDAMSILDRPDIRLFLIGPPKSRYKGVLEAQRDRLGLHNTVHILPPIYDLDEKISWYQGADLFVHPSRFDVFPIAIYEALAASCPVLVTPGTQAVDFVNEHNVGVATALDSTAIAESILKLQKCPDRLAQYSCNARPAISDRTWSETWKKIVFYLNEH